MIRPPLLQALRERVLLCDGGMGSRVQALTLDTERDYWGRENCTDVLNLSAAPTWCARSIAATSPPAPTASRPTVSAARR